MSLSAEVSICNYLRKIFGFSYHKEIKCFNFTAFPVAYTECVFVF